MDETIYMVQANFTGQVLGHFTTLQLALDSIEYSHHKDGHKCEKVKENTYACGSDYYIVTSIPVHTTIQHL